MDALLSLFFFLLSWNFPKTKEMGYGDGIPGTVSTSVSGRQVIYNLFLIVSLSPPNAEMRQGSESWRKLVDVFLSPYSGLVDS